MEKVTYAETLYLGYTPLIARGILIMQPFEPFVLSGVDTCVHSYKRTSSFNVGKVRCVEPFDPHHVRGFVRIGAFLGADFARFLFWAMLLGLSWAKHLRVIVGPAYLGCKPGHVNIHPSNFASLV